MSNEKSGAIYLRLSRDDRHSAESESISNQRRLLLQYASDHGIPVAFEFSDDGISGTTQNRSGLRGLCQAVEEGWIDTVLIKDLSRLSRNYIYTGELVEQWFPQHSVRLISVEDHVDTGMVSPANDVFAIRAVMDDWYARDISRKVRAAIYAKQRAGFCTSAALPYGYFRSEGKILPDAEKVEVIRHLFALYEAEQSCYRTAMHLNTVRFAATERKWNDTSVRRILKNTAYIGKLLLHVTEKASYKSTRKIRLPDHAAVIYPVPPVISADQFQRVQCLLRQHAHHPNPKHWLAGLVFCTVCGGNMTVSDDRYGGRLICSTRKRFGTCRAPSMQIAELMRMIGMVLSQNRLPADSAACRRLISAVRIAPESATIILRCRPADETISSGMICEL